MRDEVTTGFPVNLQGEYGVRRTPYRTKAKISDAEYPARERGREPNIPGVFLMIASRAPTPEPKIAIRKSK